MTDDRILEPSKYYNESLKKQVDDNINELFDDLVKKSKIDIEENRKTCKAYRDELSTANSLQDKISKKKGLKGLLITLTVFSFIIATVLIFNFFSNFLYLSNATVGLIIGIALIFLGIFFIVLVSVKINASIENISKEKQKHIDTANEILEKAKSQTAPLNALFDGDMTRQIIIKSVPILKIDRNFSMKRYDYLNGKYGFQNNNDIDESTVNLVTGEIQGNPFIIERSLSHVLGEKTYHGTLQISWQETRRDSNGNIQVITRHQTLHASVTKPKPYYSTDTRLIYGNDAAPDLVFTHSPTHAEQLDEKALDKYVKKGFKEIQKQSRKSVKEGGSFTEMGNEEFDVLFNGTDRNNEVQFRLLFTPLAQTNMLKLMKNPVPYGDDFYFIKSKCLNFIKSEHAQKLDMDTSASRYYSYDYDIIKKKFTDFNSEYFKSIFFDFAPLLSVPLYQQQKPREYIYKKSYERNYTNYEAEVLANCMNSAVFAHKDTATDVILKSDFINKTGKTDKVMISAYSYKTVERVDYVPVHGGDGFVHNVPVHWTQYIPLQKNTVMCLKELNCSDSEVVSHKKYANFDKMSLGKAYFHGIIACVGINNSLDLNEFFD